jgi:HD-like signal output (HDOD) protein
MLGSIPGMAAIALAVRHQHENYDGSGYPEGLSGEQIPLHSRIIKVVDAYDQMTSPRPIQRAVTHEQAIEFLKLDAGKRFDPEIVNAFCELTAISEIRRSISSGLTGMQMIASRVFCDANNLSTPELLQKFKTEPILAFDLLKLSNLKGDNEPTIQLMSAMSRVGEAGLRLFIEQNGLPESVLENDDRLTRPQRCAVAAQLLAAHTNIVHPDDAYTLGLLYDIGEILLASLFPHEMLMLGQIDEELRAPRQIELFGVDQAQVSQWMLESCGVPREFTTAVKSHREILRINTPLALLMEVANNIASTKAPHNAAAMNSIPKDILEILNLSRGDLKRIYERTNAIAEGRLETNQDVYEYA